VLLPTDSTNERLSVCGKIAYVTELRQVVHKKAFNFVVGIH
jgi:hypothetical protein